MKKVKVQYDLFSDKQIDAVEFLEKRHLLKVYDYQNLADPVADIFICKRLFIETYKIFDPILSKIIMLSIDQDGQDRIDRLMNRGLVSFRKGE